MYRSAVSERIVTRLVTNDSAKLDYSNSNNNNINIWSTCMFGTQMCFQYKQIFVLNYHVLLPNFPCNYHCKH